MQIGMIRLGRMGAITQAVCDQRRSLGISSPVFMGGGTHVLSAPATASMLEVLEANGVDVMLVPVNFKGFAAGRLDGNLGFAGGERARASFLRRDRSVWATDKDGIMTARLAAQISVVTGRVTQGLDAELATQLGSQVSRLVEAAATEVRKQRLAALSPRQVTSIKPAGQRLESILTHAAGNRAAIGGIKVSDAGGWFAACPSVIKDIYKIYPNRFRSAQDLQTVLQEAQIRVVTVIGPN